MKMNQFKKNEYCGFSRILIVTSQLINRETVKLIVLLGDGCWAYYEIYALVEVVPIFTNYVFKMFNLIQQEFQRYKNLTVRYCSTPFVVKTWKMIVRNENNNLKVLWNYYWVKILYNRLNDLSLSPSDFGTARNIRWGRW